MLVAYFKHIMSNLEIKHLIIAVVVYIAILGCIAFIKRFQRHLEEKKKYVIAAIYSAYSGPLKALMTIYALSLCVELLEVEEKFKISFEALLKFRLIVLVLFFLIGIVRWRNHYFAIRSRCSSMSKEEEIKVSLLSKCIMVVSISLSTFWILEILQVPFSTFLAIWGAGGLSIAIAAKDVIANFFGGLVLFITRPFYNGDWIKTSDGKIEGIVTDVGWYMTSVTTFDNHPTYIPNGLLSSAIIINPSRMIASKMEYKLVFRYEDLDKIKDLVLRIKESLRQDQSVDLNFPLRVHFTGYSESGLTISIECFSKCVERDEWLLHQEKILWDIGEIVKNLGAHLRNEKNE